MSARLLPKNKVSAEWNEQRLQVMTELCTLKAQQCQLFRETLLNTGSRQLIHNMETDSEWGFGEDGKGSNIMGKALENTRNILDQQTSATPIVPPTNPSVTPTNPSVTPTTPIVNAPTNSENKHKVLILSDSMLRGIERFMDPSFDVELACFGGYTPIRLVAEVDRIFSGKSYSTVIIHCGTNCTTEKTPEVNKSFNKLLDRIRWHDNDVTLLLSGVIHRLDDPSLNTKVDAVNAILQSYEAKKVLFVEHNGTIRYLRKLLDNKGLHLNTSGLKQVAANLNLALRTGKATIIEVRKWDVTDQSQARQPRHQNHHQSNQNGQKQRGGEKPGPPRRNPAGSWQKGTQERRSSQAFQSNKSSQRNSNSNKWNKPDQPNGAHHRDQFHKRTSPQNRKQSQNRNRSQSHNSQKRNRNKSHPTGIPPPNVISSPDQETSYDQRVDPTHGAHLNPNYYPPWMSPRIPVTTPTSPNSYSDYFAPSSYPHWFHPWMRSAPFRSWGPMM